MVLESTIRHLALSVGFDDCLTAPACRLDSDAAFMDSWVDSGYAGNMTYLERNRELRYDIRQLVPQAETVIVTLLTYDHSGRDYHRTVKSKLYELKAALIHQLETESIPLETAFHPIRQHIFCDSAPVLERRWATLAGLGFIGLNHQFIHPTLGSRVHIGELVMNLPCQRDVVRSSIPKTCTQCNRCVEACPAQALGQPYWDATRCIAYTTHHCLVCQQVCPHNTN